MLDVQVATLANQAMNYLVSGKVPRRNGNAHPNIQPQDVYACADGDVILVVGNDGQFAKLCEVFGRPEWVSDERFATNAQRVRNIGELSPLLRDLFAAWERERLIAALDAAGVPCGPINTVAEVFKDPQVKARGMLQHVPHPSGVDVPQVAADALRRRAAAGPRRRRRCSGSTAMRSWPSWATAPTTSPRCAAAEVDLMAVMKLHWSPKSPYVRKVMICAHELGLVERLELVRSVAAMLKPNARHDGRTTRCRRSRRWCCEDGFTLFDSVVICEYLNDAGRRQRCSRARATTNGRRCAGTRWATACSTR